MRAMTSPRRTSAPSCDSTQVSTPSRSDFVVDRSSSRRACAASLSSEPRSSARPSSCTLVGALRVGPLLPELRQLDLRLLDRQLGAAQRLAREQALLEQLLIAVEPRLRRLQLERLDLEPSVEIDERLLERQPRLRLLVLLDLEVLDDLVERQHRLADVELDDRVALLQMGAGPLQDARARARRAGSRARARLRARPCRRP